MIQFFAPDIESDPFLPEDESGHCVRVLRKSVGDTIFVTDGAGSRFRCLISDAHPRHVSLDILDQQTYIPAWGVRITLGVAPTKNADRMEWLIEKATEIGVDEIVLLKCEHSERKTINIGRLRKIMVSAMKQSLKTTLPILRDMIPFADFITNPPTGLKFFGYCDATTPKLILAQEIIPSQPVTIIIGPEGDFTPAEATAACDAGFIPVSFGESRMRTETAALFALEAVHIVNQIGQCLSDKTNHLSS